MISTCAILADAIIISYVVEDHSIYMCVLETWRITIKKHMQCRVLIFVLTSDRC